MKESRRFVRLTTRVPVDCTVLPSGTAQRIVSKDLSGGGVRLCTETRLQPGAELELAIYLPGREWPVYATAEVMWSEESQVTSRRERQQRVETGVRCVEITPDDHADLTQFISTSLRPATI